ncbi:unnamed protein product [Dracunculus medinensis]|uniref:ShKT domain-containing protein n=1 Tax=Dracunculus medinensis TaxID=318479 RepID=A0A0N4URF0_DRAME|nr:unnamed protein product [Dracunculus medinensis]
MLTAIPLFFLLPLAFADNVDIEECVKLVGNDHKKRPTVDSCPEDPVCSTIFVFNPPADIANNLNMQIFKNLTKIFCTAGNATSSSTCTDLHPQCQANARYCNIGDYAVVMRRVCRLTCHHCTP